MIKAVVLHLPVDVAIDESSLKNIQEVVKDCAHREMAFGVIGDKEDVTEQNMRFYTVGELVLLAKSIKGKLHIRTIWHEPHTSRGIKND